MAEIADRDTVIAAAIRHAQDVLDGMPPVRAMGVRVASCDGKSVRLGAPLATNVNDKGCAFGGSLSGVMTLACWSLCAINLEIRGVKAEIYVQDSSVRYLSPVFDDLLAEAALESEFDWEDIAATLRSRGRARATLKARTVLADGSEGAILVGRFVAIMPKEAS